MSSSLPWGSLKFPARGTISLQRVDRHKKQDFFWHKDDAGRIGLSLAHSCAFPSELSIPRLRGIEVGRVSPAPGQHMVQWTLTDEANGDLFHELCLDIVSAAGDLEPDTGAIRVALTRTWRWHRLLAAGAGGLLAPEEQKGLIGELTFLRALVELTDLGVQCWKGPLAEPHDFLAGRRGFEVKATRGQDSEFLSISSEAQLDVQGLDSLHLVVFRVVRPMQRSPSSVTLDSVVSQVVETLQEHRPAELDVFRGLLAATGYRPEDDYGDHPWDVEGHDIYSVESEFPAVKASELPPAVHRVRYRLLLEALSPWLVDSSLGEVLNGNP